MKWSNNDSGLTAALPGSNRLLTAGLIAISMAVFASCASQAPLDDAYHWEDSAPAKHTTQPTQTTQTTYTSVPSVPSSPSSATAPSEPSLQYLTIQDTTVTVRIKK